MTEKANEAKIRGNAFFSQSKWQDAISEYTTAINLDPTGHVYYSNRSACYAEIGEFRNALIDAEKCVELKPDWSKAHSRRGHALFKLNRLDEAAEAYKNGLKIDPDNDSLKEGLRIAESNGGGGNPFDISQMMGNLKNQIAADPETRAYLSDPEFVQKLNNIQSNPQTYFPMYLGDPKMKKVMGLMFKSMGINLSDAPEESEGVPNGGSGRYGEEESKEKKDEEKRHLSSEQKLAEEKKDAGNAAYKSKDLDKAISLYTEAISLDPKNITYLTNRATASLAKGNVSAAREDCETAISVGRAECAPFAAIAKAFERLADAEAREGNAEAALAMYAKAQLENSTESVKRKMKKIEQTEAARRKEKYLDPQKGLEHKERGNEFFKVSKWKEALEEYTESLRRNPEFLGSLS